MNSYIDELLIYLCLQGFVCGFETSLWLIRQWVKPGGSGSGSGRLVGKPGDWELGDHVIKLCLDYKLN